MNWWEMIKGTQSTTYTFRNPLSGNPVANMESGLESEVQEDVKVTKNTALSRLGMRIGKSGKSEFQGDKWKVLESTLEKATSPSALTTIVAWLREVSTGDESNSRQTNPGAVADLVEQFVEDQGPAITKLKGKGAFSQAVERFRLRKDDEYRVAMAMHNLNNNKKHKNIAREVIRKMLEAINDNGKYLTIEEINAMLPPDMKI